MVSYDEHSIVCYLCVYEILLLSCTLRRLLGLDVQIQVIFPAIATQSVSVSGRKQLTIAGFVAAAPIVRTELERDAIRTLIAEVLALQYS